ncbi:hypothetical protein D1007_26564 [Hordeum vulgare]|nr:hypothetical protein D1007_26564 [Hordeum vulgare]
MRKMDLMVVYTNDSVMVEDSINNMAQLLAEDDKYKVVGFDLAYTGGHDRHDHKVLKTSGLAYQKLVDIRDLYKIWCSEKDMDSHVHLVEAIIDSY